jgi:hypothetical protein
MRLKREKSGNYSRVDVRAAKADFLIMGILAREPMSLSELIVATGLPTRSVEHKLKCLKEAQCVVKVRGTHLLALRDI